MTKHKTRQLEAAPTGGWLLGLLYFCPAPVFLSVSSAVSHTRCTACCNSHLKRPAEAFSSRHRFPAAHVAIWYLGEKKSCSGTCDPFFCKTTFQVFSLQRQKKKRKNVTMLLCRHEILAIVTLNEHAFSSSRWCNDAS